MCRWGQHDLIAEADAGRTRLCRPQPPRYYHSAPRMSAYSALKEQADRFSRVMIHGGRPSASKDRESFADLYADIPKQHVLYALRADLSIQLMRAETAGHNVIGTQARWVDLAATTLARRFGDDVPKPHAALPAPRDDVEGFRFHDGKAHPVPADGFTNLWRRAHEGSSTHCLGPTLRCSREACRGTAGSSARTSIPAGCQGHILACRRHLTFATAGPTGAACDRYLAYFHTNRTISFGKGHISNPSECHGDDTVIEDDVFLLSESTGQVKMVPSPYAKEDVLQSLLETFPQSLGSSISDRDSQLLLVRR